MSSHLMLYHFAFDLARNHAASHSPAFSMRAFISSIQEKWLIKKHKNYHQVSLSDYLKFHLPNLQQRICAHFEAMTPFTGLKPQLYSCSFCFTRQHYPDSGCCSNRKVLVLKGNEWWWGWNTEDEKYARRSTRLVLYTHVYTTRLLKVIITRRH